MQTINFQAIGIIHTPYKKAVNIPIQGCFDQATKGYCEIYDDYRDGLKDLDQFSHAILLYHFDRIEETRIVTKPFLEPVEHGIFASRSPYRPNKIGFSIVKINAINGNRLEFTEVDILDNTPLLDIKPYVKYFDHRENVISGWVDPHFKDGRTPEEVILKSMSGG